MAIKIKNPKILFLKEIKTKILFKPFSFFLNTVLLSIIISSLLLALNWIFFNADWSVINSNLSLFVFGRFPSDEQWRPLLWLVTVSYTHLTLPTTSCGLV